MTTMPLVPLAPAAVAGVPAPAGPGTGSAASGASTGMPAAGGFAALVAGLLGLNGAAGAGPAVEPPAGAEAGTTGAAAPAVAEADTDTDTAVDVASDIAADAAQTAVDPTALLATGTLPLAVPAAPVPAARVVGAAPTGTTGTTGTTASTEPAAATGVDPAGLGSAGGVTADDLAAARTTSLSLRPAVLGGPGLPVRQEGTAPADGADAAAGTATSTATGATPPGPRTAHRSAHEPNASTGAIALDGLGLTAVTAGRTDAATTPAGAPGSTSAALATSITDQVHGRVVTEVTRLATDPQRSSHRMTLRLDPGTLGEVRVVLAMRDGAVRVRLAAHDVAHEALAAAAPELRRLLEDAGQQARVVVRELATTAPTAVAHTASSAHTGGSADSTPGQSQAFAARSDLTDSGSGQTRQGGDDGREQGRWAGTPTAPSARDGIRDAATRPGDQLTARLAGVDVSM